MKLKRDENGNVVLDSNGLPVYIHEDGTEAGFDAPAAMKTIKARNAEAKANRERAEEAEKNLKQFEGLDGIDINAAKKALKTVESLDADKLVDAQKVDQMNEAWKKKLADSEAKTSSLEGRLHQVEVGGQFAQSAFLKKTTWGKTPDVAVAYLGKHFKSQDGRVIATDNDGNVIHSRTDPSKPAEFDDALEQLVLALPIKEDVLLGDNNPGSGTPAGGSQGGGSKSINRTAFEALSPVDRAAHIRNGGTVT